MYVLSSSIFRESLFSKGVIREIWLLVVRRHPDLPLQWFKRKINMEGLRPTLPRSGSLFL